MLGETHDVLHEFPHLGGTIKELHEKDQGFAKLMDQHDRLDREIRELEERGSPTSDTHMEELKYKRTELKDQIYQYLRRQ